MTKRRVQGGEATSERRRRDGVYQKSYKRAFLPLIYLLPRARVSRTSHAWRVHAARDKSKVSGFALPTISAIPRVRTYHTKEPSRFVHALSARPLKNVWRAWAEPVRQRKQGFSPAFSCGELTDSRKRTRSASPRQGQKVARFTATDEVLLQYIAETNPISLCSHPYFRQKLNREVRHSLTWHSSKSESALERFEPVAVAML